MSQFLLTVFRVITPFFEFAPNKTIQLLIKMYYFIFLENLNHNKKIAQTKLQHKTPT